MKGLNVVAIGPDGKRFPAIVGPDGLVHRVSYWNLCRPASEPSRLDVVCILGPCTERDVKDQARNILGPGPAFAEACDGSCFRVVL